MLRTLLVLTVVGGGTAVMSAAPMLMTDAEGVYESAEGEYAWLLTDNLRHEGWHDCAGCSGGTGCLVGCPIADPNDCGECYQWGTQATTASTIRTAAIRN
jgi:hypothetical protein